MIARTFKALSALLTYPTEELQAAAREIADIIRSEELVGCSAHAALKRLVDELGTRDLFELQECYVDLFDKSRRLSLHLFEHVHGESRARGQAMVDLAALYEAGGLTLAGNELPDYLPLLLEYLSTRPLEEARGLLGNTLPILVVIEERLAARSSPYAAAFAALRDLAGEGNVTPEAIPAAREGAEDSLAALDAAWEETAIAFGPSDAFDGCSVNRLKIQMRAGQRDARRETA